MADAGRRRLALVVLTAVLVAGLAALTIALLQAGPRWLDGAGAVAVGVAYTATLAARTGGRPVVFGGLALVLGIVVVLAGLPTLRAGAAVLTCVAGAALAVMATVPAPRWGAAVREVVVAMAVAAGAALAVLGYRPVVAPARFEYAALAVSFAVVVVLVYRLGDGAHPLGGRSVAGVLAVATVVTGLLAYAEVLRRYGASDLVRPITDAVAWSRDTLGASPRPLPTLLGIPALMLGCYLRARHPMGWWVCTLGVAATAPVAHALIRPAVTLQEAALAVAYSLVVGVLLGSLLIVVLRGRLGDPDRTEPGRTHALL